MRTDLFQSDGELINRWMIWEDLAKPWCGRSKNDPNPNAEKRAWLAGQQASQKMYCQSCGTPSPYESGLRACPICKKENPGWIVIMPGGSNPQVQEYKDKAARYYSQGLFQDAIEQLQTAAKIDPTDATIFNNLGCFFYEN